MIKKLVSLVCCLLPMGAGAVVVSPESGQQSVSTTDAAWQSAVSAGNSITINTGNGIVATGRGASGDADYVAGGFSVANNMYVGVASDQGSIAGDLYILNSASNPFTIISTGDVSIGSILQVLGGKTLALQSNNAGTNFNLTVGSNQVNEGIKVGDATQSAKLTLNNIDALTVNGSVITYGDMSVDANTIKMGQVNANDGDFTVVANTVEMAGLVSNTADGATVTVQHYIGVGGTVQNNAGDMSLVLNGTGVDGSLSATGIVIGGSLENKSSGQLIVSANSTGKYGLTVGGIISNEGAQSAMTITMDSLTVNGGAGAYSLVNNGSFVGNIAGETYLANGWNLAGAGTDGVFHLNTGSLGFSGSNAVWQSSFANGLNDFQLTVRDSDLDLKTYAAGIVNGAQNNKNANMQVAAQNVYANTIQNNGNSLSVLAGTELVNESTTGEFGNLYVEDFVSSAIGSSTSLIASNTVGIAGDVTNQGDMLINGNQVIIMQPDVYSSGTVYENTISGLPNGDVVNTGANAKLTISAAQSDDGIVAILGSLTNSGELVNVSANNIAISGVVTNNSGVMNIRGADGNVDGSATGTKPLYMGALAVNGGVVNLDAQGGQVRVANRIDVTDGALNFEENVNYVDVFGGDDGSARSGIVEIAGDLGASGVAATGNGNVNVAASGTVPFELLAGKMTIGGSVNVVDDTVARQLSLVADSGITIKQDVNVANKGTLSLGQSGSNEIGTSFVDVTGDFDVTDGGMASVWTSDVSVASLNVDNALMNVYGKYLLANAGDVNIGGTLYFDSALMSSASGFQNPGVPTNGFVISGTDEYTLATTADDADVRVGSMFVGAGKTLTLDSADELTVAGRVDNAGSIVANVAGVMTVDDVFYSLDSLNVSAAAVQMADFNNDGDAEFVTTDGDLVFANINNAGSLKLDSGANVSAQEITHSSGVMDINAASVDATRMVVGSQMNIVADTVSVAGNVSVAGDLNQGGASGMLNLGVDQFASQLLMVRNDFVVESGNTTYDISGNVTVTGDLTVSDVAGIQLDATGKIAATDVTNAGVASLFAGQGVQFNNIVNNAGALTISSGEGVLDFAHLTMNSGNLVLDGVGLTMDGAIATGAGLYQGYTGALADKDINIVAQNYEISTSAIDVAQINQSGTLVVNTSDVNVAGNIQATDLRFVAALGNAWGDDNSELPWMTVDVAGDVSGGVDFIGLEKMHIAGNYVFDKNSTINAAILPYATGAGSTDVNYWSTISLADDNTLGKITNAEGGQALVVVDGKMTAGTQYDAGSLSLDSTGTALGNGQIGIDLFNVVDQGTAIWLLYADKGVENFGQLEQVRNLDVKFCNADGSLCYDYMDSLRVKNDVDLNATDENLPAYVSVRDSNGDGVADSMYVVFDPRFGGPVLLENLKIQQIVAREPDHTDGEYVAAGALDDLLIGQAHNKKFVNGSPMEIVPIIFAGTNMQEMADELYNRMEYYVENADGEGLARFSRLFQAREIELLAGAVSLNEHTAFRSFEDRMIDEFIWNRKRQLKKAWVDVDYGMFYQDIEDGKRTDGNRFSIAGGFDWQESNTLVLGLTGRISHSSSSADDAMDLGYLPDQSIAGQVKFDVADTNIGLGGYLMKILSEKTRLYGNAFLDVHMFDISRSQNFVDSIDGDGTAFSLISEWGLMHDILNQYVVGNAYVRAGYNFGFNVKEQVWGDDYMRLKSDGYFILTPGYSLTAQKKIYPSAWFQIRPYASVGVEYDVLGAPDFAKYKFAPAEKYTEYNINIDPLWVNIGGGVELLSAYGIQMGVDYRYQYNNDIQLHNIRVSGSYRF